MTEAVRLMLMIGPIVPLPAPAFFVDAVKSVEVHSSASGASGFQMTLGIDRRSDLNTLLLIATGGSASPATPALRVLIIMLMGGTPVPLFDGVMTRAEVTGGGRGQDGTITVTGEDLSAVMDRTDMTGLPYPAMPVPARVALICARYALYGIVPLPIPPIVPEVPLPTERVPAQRGTDLAYLKRMATECGYVFYVEPGPVPGVSVAYFGPELKIGVPQPALNVDMDALTNVETISLGFDPTRGVLPVVFVQNRQTRVPIPIPIPPVNPLQPPLGLLPAPIANIRPVVPGAGASAATAINAGLAAASAGQDAVEAHGTIDVLRYGRPLKARALVGLRGVGMAYDGLYFVQAVTTTFRRGAFKQSFHLTRNGLISLSPVVMP